VFKYRAISFPLLIAFLAVMVFYPQWGKYLFSVAAGAALGMLLYEMGTMLQKIGLDSFVKETAIIGAIFLTSLLLGFAFFQESINSICETGQDCAKSGIELCFLLALLAFLAMIFIGWIMLLLGKDKLNALKRTINSAGLFWLGVIPIVALSGLYFVDSIGPVGLFFVIMVTKSMDTGGYIAGMLTGKYLPGGNHKIVPSISPKKSWEGAIGGLLLSIGVSLLFFEAFRQYRVGIDASLSWYIFCGIILAIGSFAGDLTESAFKRACGVKDSGHWIPGMGGVFDVLDSFIYNGVLFWLMKNIGQV
jgi:phosphatidate cytidylyltransferase